MSEHEAESSAYRVGKNANFSENNEEYGEAPKQEEEEEEEVEEFGDTTAVNHRRLKLENENFRQEVYALRRKLELNEAMLRELQDTNDLFERSLSEKLTEKEKMLFKIEEKHRAARLEYETHITNLETKLAEQTRNNESLRDLLKQREEEVALARVAFERSAVTTENDQPHVLNSRIESLVSTLRDEEEKRIQAEETIDRLEKHIEELQRIAGIDKERLAEKTRMLENAQEELALVRAETVSMRNQGTDSDSCKGNSLFAEVEDRRRNALEKMNCLRDKYAQAKRACSSKVAEIKVLKAERAALLKKWENDKVDTLAENDELTKKYKNRIFELENKLKSEIRKNIEGNEYRSSDSSFSFVQSLLATKKKETEELRIKVEDLSTRMLMHDEAKLNITKQLRYWRYKAMSLEAQVLAVKNELDSDSADGTERKAILQSFTAKYQVGDETETTLPETLPKISSTIGASSCPTSKILREDESEKTAEGSSVISIEAVVGKSDVNEHSVGGDRPSIETTCSRKSKKILRFEETTETDERRKEKTKTQPKGRDYPIMYIPGDPSDQR